MPIESISYSRFLINKELGEGNACVYTPFSASDQPAGANNSCSTPTVSAKTLQVIHVSSKMYYSVLVKVCIMFINSIKILISHHNNKLIARIIGGESATRRAATSLVYKHAH